MTEMRLLRKAELIGQFFGEWPSFHDAEVESLLLERGGADGPVLEIAVHVFVRGPDLDETGVYGLRAQGLVNLRFSGVELEHFADFNQQNVIRDLEFEPVPERTGSGEIAVALSSSFGLEASFRCKVAEVISVVPVEVEGP